MTAAIANLALNIIMVALLVATIAYCWILNRRIKLLQDSKSELAHLLRHFDESTHRASESILALQTASKKIGENIQSRIDKANFLLDDLSFMIEKGNNLANQMEASFAVGRARNKVYSEQPKTAPRPKMAEEEDVWDTEDLLPEELKAAAKMQPDAKETSSKAAPAKTKSPASIGAVLERLSNRSQNRNDGAVSNEKAAANKPDTDNARNNNVEVLELEDEQPRSKIEQELLELLRTGVKG